MKGRQPGCRWTQYLHSGFPPEEKSNPVAGMYSGHLNVPILCSNVDRVLGGYAMLTWDKGKVHCRKPPGLKMTGGNPGTSTVDEAISELHQHHNMYIGQLKGDQLSINCTAFWSFNWNEITTLCERIQPFTLKSSHWPLLWQAVL